MIHIRNLVLVLYLGLWCSNFSNAQVVTVPLENGVVITVTTGTAATQPLQNLQTNPEATNVTMGDDSNVQVPIGFTFPYYGQQFTNSWMYSNGAVSFLGGNAPGGFCCSGQNLATLQNPQYNYSIVPLWTDLIARDGNSHYTLGNGTSRTYGWYSVSEYSGNARSSFELTIDSSGGIKTVFSGALVSFQPVTSGMIGDITKGEYYQYYHGGGINAQFPFSWGTMGTGVQPPDPCVTNPLSSSTCSGFAEALALLRPPTVSSTTTVTTTEPVVVEPTQAAQILAPATVLAAPTTNSTPEATSTQTTAAAVPVQQQQTSSRPGASLSQILSIVSTEQNRISSTERSVVTSAVSQAVRAGEQAKAEAEAVAQTSASASSTQSQSSITSQTVLSTVIQQSAGIQLQQQSSSNQQTGPTQYSRGGMVAEQEVANTGGSSASGGVVTVLKNNSSSNQNLEPEQPAQQAMSFGAKNVLTEYITNNSNVMLNSTQDTAALARPRVAEQSTVAVGVDIKAIAVVPQGYAAYSTQLTDAKFYDVKPIYQNQRVVDNVRVLRGLGSDLRHQQMIQGQYK